MRCRETDSRVNTFALAGEEERSLGSCREKWRGCHIRFKKFNLASSFKLVRQIEACDNVLTRGNAVAVDAVTLGSLLVPASPK